MEVGQKLNLTLPYTGVIRDGRNGKVTKNSTDVDGNFSGHFGFYVSTDGDWGLMALTKFQAKGARLA